MAEQEITVTVAAERDATAFIDFMNEVSAETDFIVMDAGGFHPDVQQLVQRFASADGAVDQLCLLAKADEEIIGVLNIASFAQPRLHHIGDVFIAVKKAYWHHGIGQWLMEEALYWAEDFSELKRLELTVQVRNERAVALYQRNGFDIEGVKKWGVLSSEGELLDLYAMSYLIGKKI